ncbi:hypothetical protein B0H63DRAFT_479044 [Podospora didyma]|uniref:Uncharacterized protein n=1 Tax=Podospora didyma TaxID=330526 RepID=A0AAE0NCA3_9PEZI|nr:hypothetical protein B0H63DRAFT_479044 [Podospora didyma]
MDTIISEVGDATNQAISSGMVQSAGRMVLAGIAGLWTALVASSAFLFSKTAAVLYALWWTVWWSLSTLYSVFDAILSPIFLVAHYAFAPVRCVLDMLPDFQLLYIFFGIAAVIGILAGTIVQIMSSVTTAVVTGGSPGDQSLKDEQGSENGSWDDGMSWHEAELDWKANASLSSTSKRRAPGYLLSQIIHEEDDSD